MSEDPDHSCFLEELQGVNRFPLCSGPMIFYRWADTGVMACRCEAHFTEGDDEVQKITQAEYETYQILEELG